MLRDVDPDEQFFNDVFPTYSDGTHSPYYSLERYNSEFIGASLSFNVLHMNPRWEWNTESILGQYRASWGYLGILDRIHCPKIYVISEEIVAFSVITPMFPQYWLQT